jgi:hypothetical protein
MKRMIENEWKHEIWMYTNVDRKPENIDTDVKIKFSIKVR